ncbi:diaminobutyrate--2-oxoglutarate transaminase [Anaeromassilibacillus senegalensis]|uniref:Diaminobutyrate--2-oxoglutarate transaminase n=1 Tax=Anaeromassilibacillus senegalensis TaxID=1673717 RepID=A0ABS9CK85_9FIRM|nr:diaminobutyrate--2-oxoglutarate transaminase [Anaeromassilibacillus senegalensis]MCF2651545.1 diaminobutyrate--2-oxoglutarate transaminase [Anaeromassilibacillus senegalensis]
MNTEPFEQYESEVRSYCRNFPTVFVSAKGSIQKDETGREYIDFFCGSGALNYGHNNPYIKRKVVEYLENDGVLHALDMYTAPKRDFIEYFEQNVIRARGFDYKIQFVGPTGTNAVEAALKLARKVKKRQNVFALMGAFHGMTLGSLALTTNADSRAGAGVPLNNVTHVPAPYMFPGLDTVEYMERLITDDHSGVEKPAAIILETTQADGGIYVLPTEWLQRVRALCDKHDILMIVDDVQVGCGRTGWFFSFERAGITPDIVAMSKSIGGYGMPFAITLLKPELDLWKPGEHNGTFRGYQLSLVAAKAGLEYMLNEHVEDAVREREQIVAKFMREEIEMIDSRIATRGIGLLWGVDFGAFEGDVAKAVITEAFKNGLIVERVGRRDSVVKVMPELKVPLETLEKGLKILAQSIRNVVSSL